MVVIFQEEWHGIPQTPVIVKSDEHLKELVDKFMADHNFKSIDETIDYFENCGDNGIFRIWTLEDHECDPAISFTGEYVKFYDAEIWELPWPTNGQ